MGPFGINVGPPESGVIAPGADILRCPSCGGALELETTGESRCAACGASYGAVLGIPNLVIGDAALDEPRSGRLLLHRLAAYPLLYDLVQQAAGREWIKRRVRPAFAGTEGKTVLDVGAGTGGMRSLVGATARYVWLDSDPAKLEGFVRSGAAAEAVLSNGLHLAVADRSIDLAVCSAVSHHLDDTALGRLFDEIARVVRGRLVFLDAVRTRSMLGAALWGLDRGAFPRTTEEILAALGTAFAVEQRVRFRVLHHYLLVVARPRRGA